MRRRLESMNDEKKSAALGRALLSGPYLILDDRFYHYPPCPYFLVRHY